MLSTVFGVFYRLIFKPIFAMVNMGLLALTMFVLAFIIYCRMKYRVKRLRASRADLLRMKLHFKLADFIRWKLIDSLDSAKTRDTFNEYGLTVFCGRQGAGKTISLVEYLVRMKKRYPSCIIVTNFECDVADFVMKDWHDFMEIRNGVKGVIFGIDEIQSEYSAASWKDFPEELLSEICQQRKQRIKIVASAQVFTRIAKQLREQAFTVIQCKTIAGRWTFCREYDAMDYESYCDNPLALKKKIRSKWKYSFVQSDALRQCYDTYAKIQRMSKTKFIARGERGS